MLQHPTADGMGKTKDRNMNTPLVKKKQMKTKKNALTDKIK
ncbi:MAG: hypothetical protein ABIT07_13115 [Ferruginibacter sp.]